MRNPDPIANLRRWSDERRRRDEERLMQLREELRNERNRLDEAHAANLKLLRENRKLRASVLRCKAAVAELARPLHELESIQ